MNWIFQSNPDLFDIDGFIANEYEIKWSVNQEYLAPQMQIGDIVYIWRSKGRQKSKPYGIIARATMQSLAVVQPEDVESLTYWRAPNPFTSKLRVTLKIEEHGVILDTATLQKNAVLQNLRIFKMANSTNYSLSDLEATELNSLWSTLDPPKKVAIAKQRIALPEVNHKLEKALLESKAETDESLASKLAIASKKPRRLVAESIVYERNPDVVTFVLRRAKGKCEHCAQPAPFNRRSDGTPYLEVHHKVRLADNGDDTIENALALCPNCHRRMHFG